MIKSKILKLDYSTNIQNVIYAMAIVKNNIQVVGSQSKNILYPNDYDCYEVIKIKSKVEIIDKLKSNIKKLLKMKDVYIGDIKIGVDDSDTPLRWKVAEILKGSTIVNNKTYELKNVLKEKKHVDGIHSNTACGETKKAVKTIYAQMNLANRAYSRFSQSQKVVRCSKLRIT